MIYLVAQIWGWLLVALVLGIVAGWLWTRLAGARRIEERVGEWRTRIAALERERDELRLEVGKYRDRATVLAAASQLEPHPPTPEAPPIDRSTEVATDPGAESISSETEARAETVPDQPLAAPVPGDGSRPPVAPQPETPAADAAAAFDGPAPADAKAGDDLTRIRGIGRALEIRLNGLGITRYVQIAELDEDGIRRIDNALGFRGRVTRDRWIEQAATLLASAGPDQPPP